MRLLSVEWSRKIFSIRNIIALGNLYLPIEKLMPYSKFTLEEVLTSFNLNVVENLGKFNQLPEVSPSKFLQEALEYYLPLAVAISSEKARFLRECSANGIYYCADISRSKKNI
ncbi:hypothetical protein [Dapis sp. BLCC M172]|uniref:hypothetical protein n=1 Tax=Dapis sp. BLCC M172 TaxID=2975281 RepID=UPI003CFA97CE